MWGRRLLFLLCLSGLFLVAGVGTASAVHHAGGLGHTSGAGGKKRGGRTGELGKTATEKREEKEEKGEEGQLTEVPEGASASTLASELGSSGQVDPISGLGLRNPVCDQPGEIRSATTRLACETDGTPESLYPASNYGFDVFIPTGVTHPVGDIMAGLTSAMNGLWLALLFVLKLVLTLLGLAFSLNPFSNGPTMAKISEGLQRIYTSVTDPWLSVLVVCGGVWLAYKGLIKHDVSASVAGSVLGIALLVLGLWVVNRPRETVGELASFSDQVALSVISAPQSGGLSHPVGSYAEAMSRTWNQMVEVPFAGLDFSDVKWALGPPPEEAVNKANEAFCEDNSALTALAQLQHIGIKTEEQCAKFAEARYGKPKTVLDLYLRSSPNSAARNALWNYFDNDETYKAKVAAQGGDGVITRLSMLVLFVVGLLGALSLLAWLAVRLFTQAAIAFVLLLAAPFALFFPLLGDAGRRAFKEWGLTLVGAVMAKVIYAAFLSVVMLGITVLGGALGGGSTGFLLSAAFCWAVFLKRAQLVGFLTIEVAPGGAARAGGFGFGTYAAARFGGRLAGSPFRVAGGIGHRTGRLVAHRIRMGGEATREAARGGLAEGARALADERYQEAQRTVDRYEAQPSGPTTATAGSAGPAEPKTGGTTETSPSGQGAASSPGSSGPSRTEGEGHQSKPRTGAGEAKPRTGAGEAKPRTGAGEAKPRTGAGEAKPQGGGGEKAGAGSGAGSGGGSNEGAAGTSGPEISEKEFRRAKELISRADDRKERTGQRWSENDLARFAEEDRHLLRDRKDLAEHAHRAGLDRSKFEALRGSERKSAETKVEAARERDVRRLALDENPPGLFVGRPRQAVERWRQGLMSPERREALRRIRREGRSEQVTRRRRNLSRGG